MAAELAVPRWLRMAYARLASRCELSEGKPSDVALSDFNDPESRRVLDAMADALLAPLARQWAREDHIKWLATQKADDDALGSADT
jgi:hypothetical protein